MGSKVVWTWFDETYTFKLANIGKELEEIEVTPINIPVETPVESPPVEVPQEEPVPA